MRDPSFSNCTAMEVVIDYEAVKGIHNETVIKELALVANDVIRNSISKPRTTCDHKVPLKTG